MVELKCIWFVWVNYGRNPFWMAESFLKTWPKENKSSTLIPPPSSWCWRRSFSLISSPLSLSVLGTSSFSNKIVTNHNNSGSWRQFFVNNSKRSFFNFKFFYFTRCFYHLKKTVAMTFPANGTFFGIGCPLLVYCFDCCFISRDLRLLHDIKPPQKVCLVGLVESTVPTQLKNAFFGPESAKLPCCEFSHPQDIIMCSYFQYVINPSFSQQSFRIFLWTISTTSSVVANVVIQNAQHLECSYDDVWNPQSTILQL